MYGKTTSDIENEKYAFVKLHKKSGSKFSITSDEVNVFGLSITLLIQIYQKFVGNTNSIRTIRKR